MKPNENPSELGVLEKLYLIARAAFWHGIYAYVLGMTLEHVYETYTKGNDTTYAWAAVGVLVFLARVEFSEHKWPWD